jgi:hypothetical protein
LTGWRVCEVDNFGQKCVGLRNHGTGFSILHEVDNSTPAKTLVSAPPVKPNAGVPHARMAALVDASCDPDADASAAADDAVDDGDVDVDDDDEVDTASAAVEKGLTV